MGPLPKRKLSKRRKYNRRNHDKLTLNHLVLCSNCGKYKPAHQVCPECGFYNGTQVLNTEEEE
ncbi:MAG: 50S ribosomal protein L32 [Anaerolineae bacterium]|nr:50S ribosomal protein L32 [Anaerolineae bacterium]